MTGFVCYQSVEWETILNNANFKIKTLQASFNYESIFTKKTNIFFAMTKNLCNLCNLSILSIDYAVELIISIFKVLNFLKHNKLDLKACKMNKFLKRLN